MSRPRPESMFIQKALINTDPAMRAKSDREVRADIAANMATARQHKIHDYFSIKGSFGFSSFHSDVAIIAAGESLQKRDATGTSPIERLKARRGEFIFAFAGAGILNMPALIGDDPDKGRDHYWMTNSSAGNSHTLLLENEPVIEAIHNLTEMKFLVASNSSAAPHENSDGRKIEPTLPTLLKHARPEQVRLFHPYLGREFQKQADVSFLGTGTGAPVAAATFYATAQYQGYSNTRPIQLHGFDMTSVSSDGPDHFPDIYQDRLRRGNVTARFNGKVYENVQEVYLHQLMQLSLLQALYPQFFKDISVDNGNTLAADVLANPKNAKLEVLGKVGGWEWAFTDFTGGSDESEVTKGSQGEGPLVWAPEN